MECREMCSTGLNGCTQQVIVEGSKSSTCDVIPGIPFLGQSFSWSISMLPTTLRFRLFSKSLCYSAIWDPHHQTSIAKQEMIRSLGKKNVLHEASISCEPAGAMLKCYHIMLLYYQEFITLDTTLEYIVTALLKYFNLKWAVTINCESIFWFISLFRSQLLYCSQIWRPQLIEDILTLEHIHRRAAKYIKWLWAILQIPTWTTTIATTNVYLRTQWFNGLS